MNEAMTYTVNIKFPARPMKSGILNYVCPNFSFQIFDDL